MLMLKNRKIFVILLAALLVFAAVGCKKKAPAPPPPPPPVVTPAPPPPPPPPAAPAIAQFAAEPASIQRGQSATLNWRVTGQTTSVTINQGVGTVQATGTQRVQPDSSTTYTLTAAGPGGTVTASATVNVTAPPPPPPPPPPAVARPTIEQRLSAEVQDALFDYDKFTVRDDARDILTRNATALKAILADFPGSRIVIEGHCDERGSAEYNLGLGDRRAASAKDFLVQLGVPADRLTQISYGKERPQCSEDTEACHQKNRRAHFTPGR